jgi:hypothetical protein
MMVLKEMRMSKCKRQRELKLAGREEKFGTIERPLCKAGCDIDCFTALPSRHKPWEVGNTAQEEMLETHI